MKEKKININGLRELLLVGVVLLLCVVWTVMNPQFLSVNNITNILRQASYTAIAAVGMTMIIIIGEIDLSAGSLVCAAGNDQFLDRSAYFIAQIMYCLQYLLRFLLVH